MRYLTYILLLFILIIFNTNNSYASSPIAIFNSSTNIKTYQDEHLGTFLDDFKCFEQVMEQANLNYDVLNNLENNNDNSLNNYKVIILPLLVDLSDQELALIQNYLKDGGHIICFNGGGILSKNATCLLDLIGITLNQQITANKSFDLILNENDTKETFNFSVGSSFNIVKTLPTCQILANFANYDLTSAVNMVPAIILNNKNAYLAWSLGLQGDVTNNAKLTSLCLSEIYPGITQEASIQISYAEYQTINQELNYLQKRTQETIATAKQADLMVPMPTIENNYNNAQESVNKFNTAYHARQFYQANKYLKEARQDFAIAFAQAMPVRPVEARCVWLDRGTIVSVANPQAMAKLFDRLSEANINCVYFETNNAGYAMYPSQIAQQNPNINGFDALNAAINEAHKRNIELHAWFWIFNVGNTLHNKLVAKPLDFPGPVLTSHDLIWGLAGVNGSLLPPRQHEFWIDPSYDETRNYIKSLVLEVVKKYPVDGIQLDYIRYPFNGKGSEMGYNYLGRQKFENDTGFNLDCLNDEGLKVWQAWKINNISTFVRTISSEIRQIKPNLRISAAVYAMPKRMRLNSIQQEWETWVKNGWIDTVNPMTYVTKASELSNMASYVREESNDLALVYPGLSIRQLDIASLIEQLDTSRVVGTLGTTLFAVAQLDDDKIRLLKLGPYRKPTVLTPQSQPIEATKLLFKDFSTMVYKYLQDPHKHIMSDQASTNDVLYKIRVIQSKLDKMDNNANSTQIDDVASDIKILADTVNNWLRLEAFIKRGFRAQYIANYLTQVSSILSYAEQKSLSKENKISVKY